MIYCRVERNEVFASLPVLLVSLLLPACFLLASLLLLLLIRLWLLLFTLLLALLRVS